MARIHERDKKLFPLQTINSIVELFRNHLILAEEPDLSLLSIVIGAVEYSLTNRPAAKKSNSSISIDSDQTTLDFPPLKLSTIDALYQKFQIHVLSTVDPILEGKETTVEFLRKVSDTIWNSLLRSYQKEKGHMQTLFSYITASKLDAYGVSYAVTAACQLLKRKDVHLALSEDHSWIVYGKNLEKSLEVTWHGKGTEDRRGLTIQQGTYERNWRYQNGQALKCTRQMEVASLICSINSHITSTIDSLELVKLQQSLLWILYDMNHLDKYPSAISTLADLEELRPSNRKLSPLKLYQKAIDCNVKYFQNHYVYPYTYLGAHYYRRKFYKEALECWSLAADAIRIYNYSREDESIYNIFLDISNNILPEVIKNFSMGILPARDSLLCDPECYAFLLKFYDGICQWEEGSDTPVLHITWANKLCFSLSKFDGDTRAKVHLEVKDDENTDENKENADDVLIDVMKEMEGQVVVTSPRIDELAKNCGEAILNRDFLEQGSGEPFSSNNQNGSSDDKTNKCITLEPKLVLKSCKMKDISALLTANRFNSSAIELQLTAQSQISLKHSAQTGIGSIYRAKRQRRR